MKLATFRKLVSAALLLPVFAGAEGVLVGTITGTSGASANLAVKSGYTFELQCDVDSRFTTGKTNTTAAANSGSSKGRKVSAGDLVTFVTEASDTYVAAIAADGTSTTHCDVFERPRLPR
jgi:hypothetical protein